MDAEFFLLDAVDGGTSTGRVYHTSTGPWQVSSHDVVLRKAAIMRLMRSTMVPQQVGSTIG